MPADANLVKKAAEAVKKMQELEVGQSYYDFMLQYVETPDGSTREQAEKGAKNNAEILTRQAEELIAFYKKIDTSVFMKFPDLWLEGISNQADKHHELITNPRYLYMQGMSYDEIVGPLKSAHYNFFQLVAPMLGAMVMFDNDYQKAKDAVQTFNREAQSFNVLKNSIIEECKSWKMDNLKLNEEISEILKTARGASAEAGTYQHAAFFERQGDKHKVEQIKWLKLSGVMIVVLLIYLAVSYCLLPDAWETIAILQVVIKAFGFSLLLSVLVFCIKNYKAHGHNHIVNTHRANSLKTYRAIAEGASSPDAQDIILANAAQHIFTPLDTGYVKGADSVGNPTVEIIRNVVESANKEG